MKDVLMGIHIIINIQRNVKEKIINIYVETNEMKFIRKEIQMNVEWNLIDYNHNIYKNHVKKCLKCQKEDINYCIVCGEHKENLSFCYWCGDVVCGKCCPISLPIHNSIFIAKEEE